MYYSDDLVEEIRQRNDIVDVISGYVKLQRKGSSYFGLCPFHNEKSPSFSVSPGKQMYYCFGCGKGGNVFTFLMDYENYSFPEALKSLAERAGVALPEEEYSAEAKRQQDLKSSLLAIQKQAAKFYYYQLRTEGGKQGLAYLKDRGLSDETIRQFGLGYAGKYSDTLYHYLKNQNISDELLRESGLFNVDEKRGMYDKFWNRVIFPIMDVGGRVIGFGGRVMGDGKPKYLNSPETRIFDKSRNLYGLNAARSSRKKYMLVCEGYMDVISMHQAGFTNAVASLGTALTSQHALLLKRYTDEVILTYDSDEAGVKAALRAIPMLREAGITTKVLNLKPCKDPDELIKTLGAEAFEERISQAENSFLFEIRILQGQYDLKDPDGKTAFFRAAAEKIAGFEQELERENYIEAVASNYHISFEGLRKMVMGCLMKGIQKPRPEPVKQRREKGKEDGLQKSQRLLLTWLIEYPALYPSVKGYIGPEDFTLPLYQSVAAMLYEQLEAGEVNPARIINQFTDTEEQHEAAALFHTKERLETREEILKAVRETLKKLVEAAQERRFAQMDPADTSGFQAMINARKQLDSLDRLPLSLE